MKLKQKIGSFTFDIGGGGDALFHTGVLFGARRGKGFGFSAAWVGDEQSRGANLQLWHYIETIDVAVVLRRDRRGFGWSADTGKKLAGILRGVLRYETGNGADGNGASQQLVYGRNMRRGGSPFTSFDALRVIPPEDVFDNNGINIRSPQYPQDEPLAWVVVGYGARVGQIELDRKNVLEAELVSYVTDTMWVGGEVGLMAGVTDHIETQFGITGADLDLAATFGFSPQSERFGGSVRFRWIPFKPAPPVK